MSSPILAVLPILAQAAAQTPAPHPADPQLPALTGELFMICGVLFVVGVLLQLVANWITSKVLVEGENGFGQAVKLFLMTLAGIVGTGVVGALIVVGGNAMGLTWSWLVAVIGCPLLILYVIFATPMTVYKIGFLRSVLFIVLAAVIVSIGQFGTTIALQIALKDTDMGKALRAVTSRDPAMQNAGLAWLRKASPQLGAALEAANAKTAADRAQPIAARRAALQRMREELEARRTALDPKDQAAVADYKKDAQQYTQLYQAVEADAARPAAKP